MLFYLHSTNPRSFSKVEFSTAPSVQDGQLYFRIINFSTIASFLITTVDDYLLLQIGAEIIEVRFTNRNEYDDLPSNLRELLPSEITVDLNLQGTLTLSHASQEFSIVDASHRVKLLLGLYYTPLPLQSTGHQVRSKLGFSGSRFRARHSGLSR